jgi:DNA segregation ATPase FtsK/SpoIIIE, S-DNA-T family
MSETPREPVVNGGVVPHTMELLLTLGVSSGPEPFTDRARGLPPSALSMRVDVAVELDGTTRVGMLCEALVSWLRQRRVAVPDRPALSMQEDGNLRVLDPEATVFDAGLVSGQILQILEGSGSGRVTAPTPIIGAPRRCIALDVTSGPDVGRVLMLERGRHAVGRGANCDVVVDDPTMSRRHFTIEVSDALEVVVEPNPEAKNGTLVDGRWLDRPRPLGAEGAVVAGSTQFVLRPVRSASTARRDRLGQVSFNRLPYRRPIVRDRGMAALPRPPEAPARRRFPLVALLGPAVMGVAVALVFKRPEFLLLSGLSPLMMLSNHFSESRSSRGAFGRGRAEFMAVVDRSAWPRLRTSRCWPGRPRGASTACGSDRASPLTSSNYAWASASNPAGSNARLSRAGTPPCWPKRSSA